MAGCHRGAVQRAATALAGVLLVGAVAPRAAWANGSEASPAEPPATTGTVSALLYAMPGQKDFGVAVGSVNRGALRVEARMNYEALDAASLFVGRRWSGSAGAAAGGDAGWSFEATPMIGVAFGSIRAVVPALLGSVGWRSVDAYVEAEYVHDLDDAGASYFYAWSELGWKPAEGLRIGLVGQRTRLVANERSLQRGAFAQVALGPATLSAYAFNPGSSGRYLVLGVAVPF